VQLLAIVGRGKRLVGCLLVLGGGEEEIHVGLEYISGWSACEVVG
jgi:hypothetical protein